MKTTAAEAWASIMGNNHIKRVIEIAATGEHSVLFVGPPGYGKTLFRNILKELGVKQTAERWACMCGFKDDPRERCFCSIQQIAHVNSRLRAIAARFDLVAYPARPRWGDILTQQQGVGEPYGTMLERIGMTIRDQQLAPPQALDDRSLGLLKTAYDRLGLSPGAVTKCIYVAGTIARMDGSSVIQSQHIAEAIIYRLHNGEA